MPKRPTLHLPANTRAKRKARQQALAKRPSRIESGYTQAWVRASRVYLLEHPLCTCERCAQRAIPLPASVVDHRIPHRGNAVLFWDVSNWQAMNKRCHDRKTATEDGGFGNVRNVRTTAAVQTVRQVEAENGDPLP